MTTSRDIARRAGVSQTTVSRVLNGSDKVRPDTRQRVLDALQDYRPNAQARAMRTQRTGSIGVVASQITNPYFPELLENLYASAARRGLRIVLWNDVDPAAEAAIEGALSGYIDGIVLANATANSPGANRLAELGIPTVLVNRGLEVALVDQVTSHTAHAGRLVAEYFLAAGRTRAAIATGDDTLNPVKRRRQSFLETMARAGFEIPEERTFVTTGDMNFEAGQAAAHALLAHSEKPDAVFCGNDLMAFGFMNVCRSMGIDIPRDLWVVGYDDLPMSSWAEFSLTSVSQPLDRMSEIALDLLLDRIEGVGDAPRDEQVDVSLSVRGTTANHPR